MTSSMSHFAIEPGRQIDIQTKHAGWKLGTVISYAHPLVRIETIEDNFQPLLYEINLQSDSKNWIAPAGTNSFRPPPPLTRVGGGSLIHAPSDSVLETRGHKKKSLLQRLFGTTSFFTSKQQQQDTPTSPEEERQTSISSPKQPQQLQQQQQHKLKSTNNLRIQPPLPPGVLSTQSHRHILLGARERRRDVGGGSLGGPSVSHEEEVEEEGGIENESSPQGSVSSSDAWAGYALAHSFHEGEECRTPSPIRGRRNKPHVLYVNQAVDVLFPTPTTSTTSTTLTPLKGPHTGKLEGHSWLPGRVVELRGDKVRIQVYVPPLGATQKQGTETVGVYLMRMNTPLGGGGAGETQPSVYLPHLEEITLHMRDTPIRLSFPAGLRSGVRGDDIRALWPPSSSTTKTTTTSSSSTSAKASFTTITTTTTTSAARGRPTGIRTSRIGSLFTGSEKSDATGGALPLPSSSSLRRIVAEGVVAEGAPLITPLSRPGLPKRFWDSHEAAAIASSLHAATASLPGAGAAIQHNHSPSSSSSTSSIWGTTATTNNTFDISLDSLPSFWMSLQTGMVVDAQEYSGKWHVGVITAVQTDSNLLTQSTSSIEDTIGRGGFPILPTLLSADVLFLHSNKVETLPIISGKIIPLHSRVKKEDSIYHPYVPGTFVDVVTLGESILPSFSSSSTTEQQQQQQQQQQQLLTCDKQMIIDPLVPGSIELQLPGRNIYSIWRWGEIMQVTPDAVLVQYISPDERVNGLLEWILLTKESYRLRPHGEMTSGGEIAAQEEQCRQKEDVSFIQALHDAGWEVQDTRKDGNCLFRAIMHQVFGIMNEDEARVVAVRLEIVEYMKENSDFFSPICEAFGQTLDDHLDEMRRNSSWGGYPELLAAEELYNHPILIFHSEDFLLKGEGGGLRARTVHFLGEIPEEIIEELKPLRLSYHGGNHYSSVIEKAASAAASAASSSSSAAAAAASSSSFVPLGKGGHAPHTTLRGLRIQRLSAGEEKQLVETATDAEGAGAGGRCTTSEKRALAAGLTAVREIVDEVVRRHIRRSSRALSMLNVKGGADDTTTNNNKGAQGASQMDENQKKILSRSSTFPRIG